MRKQRDITINVINNKKINYERLANFFANKYSEEFKNAQKQKS